MKRMLTALVATVMLSSAAAGLSMGWSMIIPSVAGTDVLGITLREQMQR